MTKSNCFQDFLKYSSLNVLGMIGLSCYILADTFFVSQGIGMNGLAALNLAIPIYSFIHGSGLMIGMGGGIKYSIARHHGDRKATDRIFTHAFCLAALFSLFFVAAGLFFSDGIVSLLGADEEVFAMTETYLRVILLFSPAFLLNNLLLCFVRNDGAPQLSMAAMIGGSLSNVVLDYVFIFPCQMGIFGAVFATGLAPLISILILSPHFLRKQNGFRLSRCRPEKGLFAGILSNGVPSLITELSSGVVMIAFNAILYSLQGNTGVAAYGIVANLSLVVLAIFTGIGQGIQPLLSSNFGAGNRKDFEKIFRYALVSMLILSGILYAGLFFGASPIASLFNSEKNEALQRLAVRGLKLYFIACPFAGFNILLSVYFTSADSPRPAHVLSLLRGFAVILPTVFLLSYAAGTTGVWCSFPVTECLVAAAGLLFLRASERRKKAKGLDTQGLEIKKDPKP